jgi:hypothetical protein
MKHTRNAKGAQVKDAAAAATKDWLTLLFGGLGISFSPHEWIGGMFLALAGASLARHMEPEADRRELWAVMVAAFLVSHLAALAWLNWSPGLGCDPLAGAGRDGGGGVRVAPPDPDHHARSGADRGPKRCDCRQGDRTGAAG